MAKLSNVKVGAVLSKTVYGEGEWQNALKAVAYVDPAANMGAQLVCFPGK